MSAGPSQGIRFRPTPGVAQRKDLSVLAALREIEGFQHVSRSQVQKWMESGAIRETSDGWMELTLPETTKLGLEPVSSPLEILFEDESLIVVNKPKGMSVHPSSTEKDPTLVHVLLGRNMKLSGIGGVERPGIVHRLDKMTSGSIVIAKTDLAHQGLSSQFSTHSIERKYWALCYGSPKKKEFQVESRIGRNPADRKKMAFDVKDGRISKTHFLLLEEFQLASARLPYASWIEARLETGRTHQVRVHLTHEGCSVLGDPVYGEPTKGADKWRALPLPVQKLVGELHGQALHARTLGFTHPMTGAPLRFEADAPSDFMNLLSELKK